MLRKATHIIFSLFLLLTTTGFSLSRHYCYDRLISVSVNSKPDPCCSRDGCCHDETEYFHLKTDCNIPAVLSNILVFPDEIAIIPFEIADYFIPLQADINFITYSNSLSPPDIQTFLSKNQAYLL